jgi:Flp pilus assembly protein TadD
VLLRRARPEQALAVAERGLALDPDAEGLDAIRRSAALTVRVRRFVHNPEDEEPTMLAQELLASGRPDDAFEVTRTALLSEFDDVDLLVTHARAARARGDFEEALAALCTASFEAPEWAEVWRQLAEVHADLEELEPALASASRAVALDPTDPELLALHARLEGRAARVTCREDRELDQLLDALARKTKARRAS